MNCGEYRKLKLANEAKIIQFPKLKEKKIYSLSYSTKLLIFRLLILHFKRKMFLYRFRSSKEIHLCEYNNKNFYGLLQVVSSYGFLKNEQQHAMM